MPKPKHRRRRRIKVTPRPRVRPTLARIEHTRRDLWRLTPEEKSLIKNALCPGASDQEFAMCIAESEHRRLDPFKRQIHFVPRFNRDAETVVTDANGQPMLDPKTHEPLVRLGRKVWVAQVAIDGLRHIAARDHSNYGTEDEPRFGPMVKIEWKYKQRNGQENAGRPFNAPEWASVAVWPRGAARPTVATVYWSEIYPNVAYSPLVREKPRLMLAKCAAAQALRKAYPETGSLYIPEEFAGQRPDYTDTGRRLEYPENAPTIDLALPPAADDPKVAEYLNRLSPDERAAEVAAMERDAKKSAPSTADAAPVTLSTGKTGAAPPPPAPRIPERRGTIWYRYFNESQTARIEQPADDKLITADLKSILRKFVRQGHVTLNNEELEAMKYEFDKRGLDLKSRPRESGE